MMRVRLVEGLGEFATVKNGRILKKPAPISYIIER
jgi:hypothetical protein